jgi:hypothetical protein
VRRASVEVDRLPSQLRGRRGLLLLRHEEARKGQDPGAGSHAASLTGPGGTKRATRAQALGDALRGAAGFPESLFQGPDSHFQRPHL